MRTLTVVTIVVAALIGGGYFWYKQAYPTYTYRFRLSIAAAVGGATKTASSVIEVDTVLQPGSPMFSPVRNDVHGDAVFLDLGEKGNVVALLGCNPDGTQDCIGTLVPELFGISGIENLAKLETVRGRRDLAGRFMPTLVTFYDPNDPASARVVRPNQFEEVFGPDVHFKGAWIEMTNEPVTRRIDKELPWWGRRGRPAAEAYLAWRTRNSGGGSIEPETRFRRG